TEFQAVQFLPALVIPQILLCGLFVARDDLPPFLHAVSDVMPLSYAVDAMSHVQDSVTLTADFWVSVVVIVGFIAAFVGLGAATRLGSRPARPARPAGAKRRRSMAGSCHGRCSPGIGRRTAAAADEPTPAGRWSARRARRRRVGRGAACERSRDRLPIRARAG